MGLREGVSIVMRNQGQAFAWVYRQVGPVDLRGTALVEKLKEPRCRREPCRSAAKHVFRAGPAYLF